MVPTASLFKCTAVGACGTQAIPTTGLNFLYSAAQPVLTIIADALTKIYGQADPVLTYTVTGFVGGDTATILSGAQSRVAGENVLGGPYAISQGTLSVGGFGYSITYTGSNLTITKASLVVAADPLTKVLGTPDPLLTYTVSGLKFTDTPSTTLSGSVVRDPGEIIGNYVVRQGTLLLTSTNYNMTYVPCNFTILAPTVIQEITEISLLNSPKAATAQTSAVEDKKQAAQVADTTQTTIEGGGAATVPLSICR
jgi:hypothetical protein